ncbi:putative phosphoesterase [Beggiatoa alba B18LD]|uniref:Putative phosphoesterase n=1 Tax=Beggiatoa alba B18LD TaxID=395493 RepID=I3CC88_9GAMM|nr:metallophosphoesterase family protein [Beggiatoa alba]EIJ41231.1 putative phosphoesterase [Beggiatoa alba B18LD]
MRTAIVSDIHGNLEALKTVFIDIATRSVDRVICLGDLVEGGKYNDEVVEFIKNNQIQTVQGNHDAINPCQLKPVNQRWLDQLPTCFIEEDIIFTHISPRKKKENIIDYIEAWNIFDETTYRLCFVGHLHFPCLYGSQCEFFGESQTYVVDHGRYDLALDNRYVICFGAIGYPRRGGLFIRYGIYDSKTHSLEFIKLEGTLLPYGLCEDLF